jgi:hypothetical protein
MKTLKITLALVAVALLTVSGVQSDKVVSNEGEPTYKDYSNKNLVVLDKKKLKKKSNI